MIFGSVCSGIEAASIAWYPLGWRASFLSEIDAFPRAVLKHHYPDVPLRGDFTEIQEGDHDAIDVLVGGTPCQSFSVAGLRGGLDDERGNLALEFIKLVRRLCPRWVVWENVPGVLSATSHDAPDPCSPPNDLAEGSEWVGEDEYDADEDHAFSCFLAGLSEVGYGWAYRSFDAQFFGLAQRRERVFVVGYLGDWRRAAAVLFEPASLRGNPAPSREAREGIAPTISARTKGGGGLGTDFDCDGGLVVATTTGQGWWKQSNIAGTLLADTSASDGGINTTLVSAYRTNADSQMDCHVDKAAALTGMSDPCAQFLARDSLLVAHALRAEGFDASEDGTWRGTPIVPVSVALRGRDGGGTIEIGDECAYALRSSQGGGDKPHVLAGGVRRLTPRECERLQGLPDNFTLIPYRGKLAADGPRYKAIGNSMAIPCMRWIGRRIAAADALERKVAA